MNKHGWLLVVVSLWSTPAWAQHLMALLDRGPVVLVESDKKGRFYAATAVTRVKKPIAEVWRIATDFAALKSFVPKLTRSDVERISENQLDVTFEVDAPGVDPEYTFRYTLEPHEYKMSAKWRSGDLEGSFIKWRLVSTGDDETLVYYTNASRNFSSIAQSLEDDQQTVTVGINVTSAVTVAEAIKRRAEGG